MSKPKSGLNGHAAVKKSPAPAKKPVPKPAPAPAAKPKTVPVARPSATVAEEKARELVRLKEEARAKAADKIAAALRMTPEEARERSRQLMNLRLATTSDLDLIQIQEAIAGKARNGDLKAAELHARLTGSSCEDFKSSSDGESRGPRPEARPAEKVVQVNVGRHTHSYGHEEATPGVADAEFVQVARLLLTCGPMTLSEVAEDCDIAASAVEAMLGSGLLKATPRGMQVTAAGRRMLGPSRVVESRVIGSDRE